MITAAKKPWKPSYACKVDAVVRHGIGSNANTFAPETVPAKIEYEPEFAPTCKKTSFFRRKCNKKTFLKIM